MNFLRRFLSKIEGLSSTLLLVGLVGFFVFPATFVKLARENLSKEENKKVSKISEAVPFVVSIDSRENSPDPIADLAIVGALIMNRGVQASRQASKEVGWLKITYPEAIRENEDLPLVVEYNAASSDAWSNNRETGKPKLSVDISAANLTLSPQPLTYVFDDEKIAQMGKDENEWTVLPRKEGDYTILVRFTASPSAWSVGTVAANGDTVKNSFGNIPLRVSVYTIYEMPQIYVNMLEGLGAIISFVLTLPAVSLVFDWYIKRRLKQHIRTRRK